MKKCIKYFSLVAILFLFGVAFVNAKEMTSNEIPVNSYVIGTHVFTENVSLSTSHIMLAAKTIDSDRLEDMIIYYKTPRGNWINGATGESLTVSASFDVKYVDLDVNLATPILSILSEGEEHEYYAYEDGFYKYTLGFNSEDYTYLDVELGQYVSEVEGIEYYEKNSEEYILIKNVEFDAMNGYDAGIDVEAGTSKTFVIKLYMLDSRGNKLYSDYSNEIVLDNTKLETPILSILSEEEREYYAYEDGFYKYTLGFNSEDYTYLDVESAEHVSDVKGIEYYEKNGEEYIFIKNVEFDAMNGYDAGIDVEAGTNKTFVIKLYTLDSKGNKVFSEYSNELVLDNTKPETPVLNNPYANDGMDFDFVLYEDGMYMYDLSINSMDYLYDDIDNTYIASGYDIFEKVGSEYNYITTSTMGGAAVIEVEAGTSKTLVARVYVLNSKGEKVYSDNSNELVLDNTKPETPTLTDRLHAFWENGLNVSFAFDWEGAYEYPKNESVSGWELYEKIDNQYVQIDISNGPTVFVEYGERRTFVAKVYILNSDNQKIYSDYSNEIVLEFVPLTPTLTNVLGDIGENGSLSSTLNIFSEGYYADSVIYATISGWELYEKIGEEYIQIDISEGSTITVEIGESRIFVARVYYDTENGIVYSDYSEEIVIENELTAPTLIISEDFFVDIDDKAYGYSAFIDYETYKIGGADGNENILSGWEIYATSDNNEGDAIIIDGVEYFEHSEAEADAESYVLVDFADKYTYRARVYVEIAGVRTYSDWSNEVVIENELVAPTLTNVSGEINDGVLSSQLVIDFGHEIANFEFFALISGWEVYEVIGEEYIPAEKDVTLEFGESKTFVARVYLDTENGRVYSNYSNEVVIENK